MNNDYSERIPFPAAQGVTGWWRKLAGVWFKFTYVRPGEGWWGVGPEGSVTVRRPIFADQAASDYYTSHNFQLKL